MKKDNKYIIKNKRANHSVKRRNYFLPLFLIAFVFAILTSSLILFNTMNSKSYVVLNGNKIERLSLNTEYNDPGIKFFVGKKEVDLNDEDITYEVLNVIDSDQLGDYSITYNIKYNDEDYTIKRDVIVVDNVKPVIDVDYNEVSIVTCNNNENVVLNYTALDNYDGIITDKVNVIKQDNSYLLSVTDSSGNTSEKTIPINYVEEDTPVINLIGGKIAYVKLNDNFVDKGSEATDACGHKLNDDIVVTNDINNTVVGDYTATYTITTAAGKTASVTRTIKVYDPKTTIKFDAVNNGKVVYLTFDDGPGQYTENILNILKKYNIKATFFVTSQFKDYVPLIKNEYEQGHTIAVHSLTHKWSIYSSVETYLKDFNDMNLIVESYTGKKTKIFRFPGGSSNEVSKKYATGVVSAIASKMNSDGYVYFDWNVDSNDAMGASSKQIYNNVINGIKNRNNSVVLMHDIKKNTNEILEDIIIYGLQNGYTFDKLSIDSPTVHHGIRN